MIFADLDSAEGEDPDFSYDFSNEDEVVDVLIGKNGDIIINPGG